MKKLLGSLLITVAISGLFFVYQPAHAVTTTNGKYFDHAVVIMLENNDLCSIYTGCGGSATYLSQLANTYSLALDRTAIDHPSEPNYLALGSGLAGDCSNPTPNIGGCMPGGGSSGSCGSQGTVASGTCSFTTDCGPQTGNACFMGEAPNLVDLLGNASLTYSFYLEGESDQTCGQSFGTAYHAWPLFFNDIVAYPTTKCTHVHSFSTTSPTNLVSELNGTTPSNLIWINPDNSHNCHDDGVTGATGCDTYMSNLIPQILTTKSFENTPSVVVVTFDEGGNGPSHDYPNDYVYTVFAGPGARKGYQSSTFYSSYSILKTIEDNWQLPSLQSTDSSASNMFEFFSSVSSSFSPSTLYQRYYTVCNPACYITPLIRSNSTLMTLSSVNGFSGTVTASISPYNSDPTFGPVTNFAGSGTNTETFTIPSGGSASDNIQALSCRATPSGNWVFTVTVTGSYGVINSATGQFTVVVTGTGRNQSCPI